MTSKALNQQEAEPGDGGDLVARAQQEAFRREVQDKLSVAASTDRTFKGQQARILKQCEDFLCEQFNEMQEALLAELARLQQQQDGFARLVREQLDPQLLTQDASYCWWCGADINGKNGSMEPHEDDCWRVRAEAELARLTRDLHQKTENKTDQGLPVSHSDPNRQPAS